MLIKLTDQDGKSRNGVKWRVGDTVTVHEEDRCMDLCGSGILHCYDGSIELALMLNPTHARIKNPRAFEVMGEAIARDGQIKAGAHELYVVRELDVPKITAAMRVRFAIYCSQVVVGDQCPLWSSWAGRWLYGFDRGGDAAVWAAAAAAATAAWATDATAAWASASTASTAAWWVARDAEAKAKVKAAWKVWVSSWGYARTDTRAEAALRVAAQNAHTVAGLIDEAQVIEVAVRTAVAMAMRSTEIDASDLAQRAVRDEIESTQ